LGRRSTLRICFADDWLCFARHGAFAGQ
jgi:hypothetical protein